MSKKYLKHLARNYPLVGDDSTPSGGFPPIYLCTGENIEIQEEKQYTTYKSSVSIKDIIGDKPNAPFI